MSTEQLSADLAALDTLEGKRYAHNYAMTDIFFAGETHDPAKGAAGRGEALAWLEQENHELLCSESTRELLDRLGKAAEAGELDAQRADQVRILKRDYDQAAQVPADVAAAFTRLTVESNDVWHKAKANNDWASFEPYLDKVVAAMREMAAYKNPDADPYDVWLGEFEQGSNRAFYDEFFSVVKAGVVPLVQEIIQRGWQPSRECISGTFDPAIQHQLAWDMVDLEGIDRDTIVVAETEHPFSDSVTSKHAFIAMHIYPNDVMNNVYSMLHEGGHSLYELGCNPAYDGTCLHGGTSMGMHEAQSRFYENIVGRSRAFAEPLLACMRKRFPERFAHVDAHEFWLACNRAEPSLIRCDADELTYALHILVRYEIEQLLFSGEATAKDVPGLWADKYKSYLGLDIPTDTQGALQDTHWSDGSIGYFPTYALGSAYGAQLKHAMVAQGVDFDGACAAGNLAPITSWLAQNVWQYGRAKDPAQIISDACGEPFDPTYFTRYLQEKFSGIYGL